MSINVPSGNFVTFSGNNSYGGQTSIAGSLLTEGSTAIPDVSTVYLTTNGSSIAFHGNEVIGGLGGVSGTTVSYGGRTLTFGGNGLNSTFSGRMISNASSTLVKNGSGTIEFTNPLVDIKGTLKVNDGTVRFTGLAGTPFLAWNPIIQLVNPSSVLQLNNANERIASLSGSGIVEMIGGKTLAVGDAQESVYFFGKLNGDGSLEKVGTGELLLAGNNTFTGSVTITAGTLAIFNVNTNVIPDATPVIFNGGTFKLGNNDETIGSISGTGTIDLDGYINVLSVGANNSSTTFTGNVTGTRGGFNKVGTGTLTLATTGTYGGPTIVTAGKLILGDNGAAINNAGAVTVNGGELQLGLANEEIGSLAGGTAGIVRLENGGPRTLTAGSNKASTTFAGQLTGSGSLVKAGTGTLTLSNSSSDFSGGVTVNKGTLAATASGALGTGLANVNAEATLLVSGAGTVLPNHIVVSEGTLDVGSGASVASVQVNGGLANVEGEVGALVLASGTLSGIGTINSNLVVGAGASLAPGNSPGTLHFDQSLTLGSGGEMVWEMRDASGAAGSAFDSLEVSGSLIFTATTALPFQLRLSTLGSNGLPGLAGNFNPSTTQTWLLATAGNIQGFDSSAFQIDASGFMNAYPQGGFSVIQGNGGHDLLLQFSPVPEPTSFAALAGASGLLLGLRRRKLPA